MTVNTAAGGGGYVVFDGAVVQLDRTRLGEHKAAAGTGVVGGGQVIQSNVSRTFDVQSATVTGGGVIGQNTGIVLQDATGGVQNATLALQGGVVGEVDVLQIGFQLGCHIQRTGTRLGAVAVEGGILDGQYRMLILQRALGGVDCTTIAVGVIAVNGTTDDIYFGVHLAVAVVGNVDSTAVVHTLVVGYGGVCHIEIGTAHRDGTAVLQGRGAVDGAILYR